jgi:hypothetical protein
VGIGLGFTPDESRAASGSTVSGRQIEKKPPNPVNRAFDS